MNKSRVGIVFFILGVILLILNGVDYIAAWAGSSILPGDFNAMLPIGAALFVIGIGLTKKKSL